MKKQKQIPIEEKEIVTPTSEQIYEVEEQKIVKYVVVRNGYRVSDQDFMDPLDPYAIKEKEFWTLVSNKHSHGEPVEIVEYDSRKHRVW